jgi:hypothetical protein
MNHNDVANIRDDNETCIETNSGYYDGINQLAQVFGLTIIPQGSVSLGIVERQT